MCFTESVLLKYKIQINTVIKNNIEHCGNVSHFKGILGDTNICP